MTKNLTLLILFAALVLVVLAASLVPKGATARDSGLPSSADPFSERAVAAPLDTTFTYQGELTDNGNPANGTYDFQFILYDALVSGSQVGATLTVGNLTVTDGLFNTALDFGSVFDGTAYWLNIAVRPGTSTGAYTSLTPRQPLTAAPYAAGLVPGAVISGTIPCCGGVLNLRSTGDGLVVDSAGGDGVEVTSAGQNGVYVGSTGFDGVYVGSAGNHGLYVGSAVSHGLVVASAGNDGVRVGSPAGYGVFVDTPGESGLWVNLAGTYGVNVAGSTLAGYFLGNIEVSGSCTGCLLATFGVNNGSESLQPGDLVTIEGVQPSGVDSVPILMEVALAEEGQTVVGVVGGWAELIIEEEPRPTEIGQRLIPREGPVEPGAYVTIIYNGPVQVRASRLDGLFAPGMRLTLGDDSGVRALQTTELNGIQIAESAPVIGIALSEPDADGLVWVLVNPQ